MRASRAAALVLVATLVAASFVLAACRGQRGATPRPRTTTEASRTSGSAVSSGTTQSGAAEEEATAPTIPPVSGRLPEVDVPPPHTVAMLDKGSAAVGSYAIAFRPFGTGPTTEGASTLVIHIDRAQPHGLASGKPFPFEGKNALVRLSSADRAAITGGGSYRGIVELRVENDVLVPWLTEVSAR